MKFTTDALVIKEMNIGDNDRLVTLLSKEYGVIKAFAAGAKSIKSKKGSATGLLSYSNFLIEKKSDTYKIREATPNKIFFGAGDDIEILSLAQYFCELSAVLGPYGDGSEEFLRLILNSLHFLTENKKNPTVIKAITELRIAVISGYAPSLLACDSCGKTDENIMYFKLTDGVILCDNCKSGDMCRKINRTVLDAMRHIVYSKFENLYSFEIPQNQANILSEVTEKYICIQSEHHFKTLEFYKSIL
ncbi:MAG: DNA repair protein RecO [Clostridia bacterium]|nr:DNA repair protein RecO [Clostridia bacterium]